MKFVPLHALHARPDLASHVACPPYDVLTEQEARELAAREPDSFVGVIRPEVLFPESERPAPEALYAAARSRLEGLVRAGRLLLDPEPAYFVYSLEKGEHHQYGVVGIMSVEDYQAGRVRRHEQTREDKLLDRIRHMEALEAQTGLVLQFHTPMPELRARIESIAVREPFLAFVRDGVRHCLWRVGDPRDVTALRQAFSAIPVTYIADGHHRAEAAAALARKTSDPDSPRRFFLTAVFPEDQLRIEGYHRVVRDLSGRTPESFLDALRARGFEVQPASDPRPPRRGTLGMVLGRHCYHLRRASGQPDSILDVTLLAQEVLQPLLGIEDPRRDPRLEFVGGDAGIPRVVQLVREGRYAVGFLLHPVSTADLRRVADAGGIMPPKSTWFEPKLLSGLVVHCFTAPRARGAGGC